MPAAQAGQLVTFGITPDRPETGYGYFKLATAPEGITPVKLDSFVEKPDVHTATAMLADGKHLWNGGIFLFWASDFIAAFETHAPALMACRPKTGQI